jgi:hypothetical protein
MKCSASVSKSAARTLALAWSVSVLSCGGHVNVGGDKPSAAAGGGGAAASPFEPETLRELPAEFMANNLVVAGSYLYLSGYDGTNYGVFRCPKDHCVESLENVFKRYPEAISWLQSQGDRLGILIRGLNSTSGWIGSCLLPACGDTQTVISGLPNTFSQAPPLFSGDMLYFFIDADQTLYRCQLPDCAAGPQPVWTGSRANQSQPQAVDAALFWISDAKRLYRALDSGRAPAESLEPGLELQVVPPVDPSGTDPNQTFVSAIAADSGRLYAALAFGQAQNCSGGLDSCRTTVVSWPAQGPGQRTEILTIPAPVEQLFVTGGELVWTTPIVQSGFFLQSHLEMWSCRVEACAETQRFLGPVSDHVSRAVADDRYLYWIAGAPSDNQFAYDGLIQRAALLPPP